MGRKSKYTPDRIKTILETIEKTGSDRAGDVYGGRFDRLVWWGIQ